MCSESRDTVFRGTDRQAASYLKVQAPDIVASARLLLGCNAAFEAYANEVDESFEIARNPCDEVEACHFCGSALKLCAQHSDSLDCNSTEFDPSFPSHITDSVYSSNQKNAGEKRFSLLLSFFESTTMAKCGVSAPMVDTLKMLLWTNFGSRFVEFCQHRSEFLASITAQSVRNVCALRLDNDRRLSSLLTTFLLPNSQYLRTFGIFLSSAGEYAHTESADHHLSFIPLQSLRKTATLWQESSFWGNIRFSAEFWTEMVDWFIKTVDSVAGKLGVNLENEEDGLQCMLTLSQMLAVVQLCSFDISSTETRSLDTLLNVLCAAMNKILDPSVLEVEKISQSQLSGSVEKLKIVCVDLYCTRLKGICDALRKYSQKKYENVNFDSISAEISAPTSKIQLLRLLHSAVQAASAEDFDSMLNRAETLADKVNSMLSGPSRLQRFAVSMKEVDAHRQDCSKVERREEYAASVLSVIHDELVRKFSVVFGGFGAVDAHETAQNRKMPLTNDLDLSGAASIVESIRDYSGASADGSLDFDFCGILPNETTIAHLVFSASGTKKFTTIDWKTMLQITENSSVQSTQNTLKRARMATTFFKLVGSKLEKFLESERQSDFTTAEFECWMSAVSAIHSWSCIFRRVGMQHLILWWFKLREYYRKSSIAGANMEHTCKLQKRYRSLHDVFVNLRRVAVLTTAVCRTMVQYTLQSCRNSGNAFSLEHHPSLRAAVLCKLFCALSLTSSSFALTRLDFLHSTAPNVTDGELTTLKHLTSKELISFASFCSQRVRHLLSEPTGHLKNRRVLQDKKIAVVYIAKLAVDEVFLEVLLRVPSTCLMTLLRIGKEYKGSQSTVKAERTRWQRLLPLAVKAVADLMHSTPHVANERIAMSVCKSINRLCKLLVTAGRVSPLLLQPLTLVAEFLTVLDAFDSSVSAERSAMRHALLVKLFHHVTPEHIPFADFTMENSAWQFQAAMEVLKGGVHQLLQVYGGDSKQWLFNALPVSHRGAFGALNEEFKVLHQFQGKM
eukprot:Lankesteria_metandrocarpae@DN4418_c0_g1_i2.p1